MHNDRKSVFSERSKKKTTSSKCVLWNNSNGRSLRFLSKNNNINTWQATHKYGVGCFYFSFIWSPCNLRWCCRCWRRRPSLRTPVAPFIFICISEKYQFCDKSRSHMYAHIALFFVIHNSLASISFATLQRLLFPFDKSTQLWDMWWT